MSWPRLVSSATVFVATGLREPRFSRRTRATLAPAGAVKRTVMPLCLTALTRSRDGTRRRLTRRTAGRDGACTTSGAGALTTAGEGAAGAAGAGATVPLPARLTTWVAAAVLSANV